MELIVGARDKRDLATIDGFLSQYPVVPLSEGIHAVIRLRDSARHQETAKDEEK